MPVLVYHGVGDAPTVLSRREAKYWVPGWRMREHFDTMRTTGRRAVIWQDLDIAPESAVMLTFDDGLVSNYTEGLPLLREFGWTATFFVNSAHAGKPGYLSWRQMREMIDAGMSIQSHGRDHVDLTRLSTVELFENLKQSKDEIEQRVGREVLLLAAPFGEFNQRVLETAIHAGYHAVMNSDNATAVLPNRQIPRIAVYRHTRAAQLNRLLNGAWTVLLQRRLRSTALFAPRKAVRWLHANHLDIPSEKRNA